MKLARNHVIRCIEALLATGAKRATYYVSPNFTVVATRTHRQRANARSSSIIVSFGAPNFASREFIRRCQKAGEPFPVKKVQLKFYPTRRKS